MADRNTGWTTLKLGQKLLFAGCALTIVAPLTVLGILLLIGALAG